MESPAYLLLAADVLLAVHALFIGFVVSGPVLIVIGHFRSWSWVLNPWYRLTHLLAIGFVIVQAWLGRICPLTLWEVGFRMRAGEPAYEGTFVGYWLGRLVYFDAPLWVFAAIYSLFGLLVVGTWIYVRPRPFS
jgi:hypothetical protein